MEDGTDQKKEAITTTRDLMRVLKISRKTLEVNNRTTKPLRMEI